jgi:hypothetical protein
MATKSNLSKVKNFHVTEEFDSNYKQIILSRLKKLIFTGIQLGRGEKKDAHPDELTGAFLKRVLSRQVRRIRGSKREDDLN